MWEIGRVTDALLDVFEVLLTGDPELYGLKIARLSGLKTGTVYPLLSRLEAVGWVESHWERTERADRGPRRRFYQLSAKGLAGATVIVAERRPAGGRDRQEVRPRPIPGLLTRLRLGGVD